MQGQTIFSGSGFGKSGTGAEFFFSVMMTLYVQLPRTRVYLCNTRSTQEYLAAVSFPDVTWERQRKYVCSTFCTEHATKLKIFAHFFSSKLYSKFRSAFCTCSRNFRNSDWFGRMPIQWCFRHEVQLSFSFFCIPPSPEGQLLKHLLIHT